MEEESYFLEKVIRHPTIGEISQTLPTLDGECPLDGMCALLFTDNSGLGDDCWVDLNARMRARN